MTAPESIHTHLPYAKEDFVSGQDVRWCPGCGDYAILSVMQRTLAQFTTPRENHVFISGIGCASRFPYYMNTYGFHTIHGRAPAIATGLKCARPDLTVWVVTGDGDGLSIGGNHLIHCMRRNVDLNIILVNNQIYGLTKGQYSPTSEKGKITKSSPYGTIDYPINPLCVAIAAEGSADILVIGTTNDPATPYVWAVALADQLENGHLVTYEGEGHTAYTTGNPCVQDVVDSFFIDDVVPDADPMC